MPQIVNRFDKTSSALTAVAVHALVRRSPLFYYILISGRARCCVGKAKAITIINLFLLPSHAATRGTRQCYAALIPLFNRRLQFHSTSHKLPGTLRCRACFSTCPSRTKIGPVKNNEVAPVQARPPSDSPPPFNGIFTLRGLSARNDHYEL